jgi:hypothetical protein
VQVRTRHLESSQEKKRARGATHCGGRKDILDKHGQTRCRQRIRQSCTAERGVKRAAVGRRRPQQFPSWYAVHLLRLPFLPRRLLAVAADKAKAPWRRPVLCRMSEVCHLRSARHPNAMTLIVPGRLKLKSVALVILISSALSTDALYRCSRDFPCK